MRNALTSPLGDPPPAVAVGSEPEGPGNAVGSGVTSSFRVPEPPPHAGHRRLSWEQSVSPGRHPRG